MNMTTAKTAISTISYQAELVVDFIFVVHCTKEKIANRNN